MELEKRQGCAGQGSANGIRQGASPQERADKQKVRFSTHAAARIEKRGVKLSPGAHRECCEPHSHYGCR